MEEKNMQIQKNAWKYIKMHENAWKYIKMHENAWKCMKKIPGLPELLDSSAWIEEWGLADRTFFTDRSSGISCTGPRHKNFTVFLEEKKNDRKV